MPNEQSPDQPDNSSDIIAKQDQTLHTMGGMPAGGEFAPGDVVGGAYEILSFIGAGGMGNVYRVRHTIMQTEYALKTLSSDKVTEVAWRRFQVEAQAIARMSHPNIVGIYNLGLHNGQLPYYVMDILSGRTLLELLQEKKYLEIDQALPIFLEVCAGIGYAHKKGIVHRDIKPGNIVVLDQPDGSGARVKIVDFGIAKLSHTSDLANQQLTGMGEVCGSPFYMSPEQCQAGKIDARSDTYSLGCTLFEALTGSPPFKGRNAMETMLMHGTNVAPTLASASGRVFPSELESALAQSLAKAPMDRYQTTEGLAQDLENVLRVKKSGQKADAGGRSDSRSETRSPFVLLTLALLALLIMAFVGVKGYGLWRSSAKSIPNQADTTTKGPDAVSLHDNGPTSKDDTTHDTKGDATLGTTSNTTNNTTSNTTGNTTGDKTSNLAKPQDKTPWATIDSPSVPGKSYIHFKFPRDICLGVMTSMASKLRCVCQGQLPPLVHGTCVYAPDATVVEHPEYFERFGPSDLWGLTVDTTGVTSASTDKFDVNVFKHCLHLKSLVGISFIYCSKLNDSVMDYVEQFPFLTKFTSIESNISMARLARSPILKRLDQLSVSTKEDLHPLLQALKGSTAMQVLDTSGSQLSSEDIKLIATMPNIFWLRSKRAAPTDADLRVLSKMTKLKRIDCSKAKLTANADPKMLKIVSASDGPENAEAKAKRAAEQQSLKDLFPTGHPN